MGAGASVGSYQDAIDQCVSVLKDKEQIRELWSEIDFNGNGYVSLAEIDKVGIVLCMRLCQWDSGMCHFVNFTYETIMFCNLTSCVISTDGSATGYYWKGFIQKF